MDSFTYVHTEKSRNKTQIMTNDGVDADVVCIWHSANVVRRFGAFEQTLVNINLHFALKCQYHWVNRTDCQFKPIIVIHQITRWPHTPSTEIISSGKLYFLLSLRAIVYAKIPLLKLINFDNERPERREKKNKTRLPMCDKENSSQLIILNEAVVIGKKRAKMNGTICDY